MTREEAIKVLSSYDVNGVWADVDGKPYNAEEQAEAFDMAIEALQTPPITQRSMYQAGYRQAQEDRPRGEWNDIGGVIRWGCSLCHYAYDQKFNFCPNCGADMRGEDE